MFSESLSSGVTRLVMTMTETKTYKKTNTKTRTKCFQDPMYAIFFSKQGVQGFKILYWLSSCDDKDKDKDKDKVRDKDKVKEKDKVLPRPNVCYFSIQKQGVQRFEIFFGCLLLMTKTKTKTKTKSKTQTKTKTRARQRQTHIFTNF